METINENKVMQAVSVGAADFMELLTGAATHAHAKSDIIALNAVKLSTIGGSLVADATDRYRLVRGTIEIYIVENESGTLDDTLLSLADIKQAIQFCKGLIGKQAVTLTRSGDILSLSCGGKFLTLSVLSNAFPPFNDLLAPVEPAALTDLFFNPKYFADIAKLCGKDKGKHGVKVTFGAAANKAYSFKVKGDLVEWHGLVMPMREYK